GMGRVSLQGRRDITAASISVTTSHLTVTYSVSGTNKFGILTISGLEVQAFDGGDDPGAGYLLQLSANPGTGNIAGLFQDSTTFGLLNQIAGAPAALSLSTQPAATATAGFIFNPQPE